MGNNCVGFPWFHRKDYEELLKIFIDSDLMPKAYDEWILLAEEGLDRLIKDGLTVKKVNINPETFPAWCEAKGLNIDAKARIIFADDYIAWKYFRACV
jgi:hypothetical protein